MVVRFVADLGDIASWGVGGFGSLLFVGGILILLHRKGVLFALPAKKQEQGTPSTNDYLSKLAEKDQRYLHERLRIKDLSFTFDYLKPVVIDPYFELKLSLWNWSLFNINASGVEGCLSHIGQLMGDRVVKTRSTNAHHGHYCDVVVRQWVSRERADAMMIERDETGRLELNLSTLRITFDAWMLEADEKYKFLWSYQGKIAFTKECDWHAPPLGY